VDHLVVIAFSHKFDYGDSSLRFFEIVLFKRSVNVFENLVEEVVDEKLSAFLFQVFEQDCDTLHFVEFRLESDQGFKLAENKFILRLPREHLHYGAHSVYALFSDFRL
jgi:hypothetical protein